ncbi:MAG: efflux RND transporter periplasmic adaptor subunit [Wenzhouxiangella sp.]
MVRIPVEVAAARLGTISAFYSATATLEADGEARVVPRLGGRITSIQVEEGDLVKAGDVLARIDDDRLRLELARAEADMSRLRQDFNRQQEMHQRNLISTEVFERLKYELEAQQAMVELVRLEMSYTSITAPITGVVSQRMIKVGNMVNTTEPAFVVTAMDPILATLHVPERELARLRPGQPALLRADAMPGEQFVGHVARISPVIDASSGTFRVTVELRDSSGRLRPGMFGRFSIVHDSREQAVLIPVDAVMNEDGRQSVFVVNSQEAQRRTVQVGYRNNGDYEIVAGLEPGERVVVTGQASLRSGADVLVLGDENDDTTHDDLMIASASGDGELELEPEQDTDDVAEDAVEDADSSSNNGELGEADADDA